MGLQYPKIKAEGLIFRETFVNPSYISGNGGIADTGSYGTAANGLTVADDTVISYANPAVNRALKSGVFSLRLGNLISNVGVDGGAVFGWYADVNNRFYVELPRSANSGWRVIANINGGGALAGTGATVSNGYNEVVVTFDGATWKAYLNGVASSLSGPGVADLAGMIGDSPSFYIGGTSTGLATADGELKVVEVYDRVLTEEEALDLYESGTFSDADAGKAEYWLPLKTKFDDGSNIVTENIGDGGVNAIVGDGAGADEPALLTPRGMNWSGTEYLNFGNNFDFDNDEAQSFVGMFETDGQSIDVIASKSDGATAYKGWQVYLDSNGELVFRIYENGTGTGIRVDTNTAWDDGQKHTFAITYDGGQLAAGVKMYIDGEEQATTAVNDAGFTGSTLNTANMLVGESSYGSNNFFGDIYFLAQYDEELTPTQVKYLNNRMWRELNT